MVAPKLAMDEPEPEAEPEHEIGEEPADLADDLDVEPEEPTSEGQKEALVDPVPGSFDEDFFDGMESVDDSDDPFGGATDDWSETPDAEDEDAESEPHSFADVINSGFARMAVIGLEDETKKTSLKGEFEEVFAEFQLGHYGNELMHEYVLHGEDDIDPVWGFCGAMVMCLGLVVYMRPDGDEMIADAMDRVNLGGR